MTPKEDWVTIAVIMGAHSLKGGLRIKPLTRSAEDFLESAPEEVFHRRSGTNDEPQPARLTDLSLHQDGLLGRIEGISDRSAAERLKFHEILIPQSSVWELPDEEFYSFDLKGLEVIDLKTSKSLGKVKRADEGAAHDYLVISHPENPRKDVMIPLLKQFVPEIDLESGKVMVRLPEGLLDI